MEAWRGSWRGCGGEDSGPSRCTGLLSESRCCILRRDCWDEKKLLRHKVSGFRFQVSVLTSLPAEFQRQERTPFARMHTAIKVLGSYTRSWRGAACCAPTKGGRYKTQA